MLRELADIKNLHQIIWFNWKNVILYIAEYVAVFYNSAWHNNTWLANYMIYVYCYYIRLLF